MTTLLRLAFVELLCHDTSVGMSLSLLPEFFALPAETKRALDYRHSYAFRGYISRGAENTAGVVDEREQVEIGDEAPAHADPTFSISSLWYRFKCTSHLYFLQMYISIQRPSFE